MEQSHKRIALAIVMFPAMIPWIVMCFIGLIIFGHGFFRDIDSFLFTLLSVSGLASMVVAFFSVMRLPKVSKLSFVFLCIGNCSLLIGVFSGLVQEPLLLFSATCLVGGSGFILADYVKGT